MADSMKFDFSELDTLAADLGEAPSNAGPNLRSAIEVTAHNIKDAWKEPLQGSSTVRAGAASITYDIGMGVSLFHNAMSGTTGEANSLTAEIGPELKGQGAIVGMLEYGTPTTAPRGFGAAALEKNQDDFVRGIERAIDDSLKASEL